MALDFPSSPTNNQVYENYIYSATSGAWQKLPGNTFATTAISDTPPVNPANGDLWWNSNDGKFYIYYSDGSSAQWVSAALPAVAVSDTPPAGYDGQMWLDSTDGSMYVYYTDPGGASSSWIGAVSRSGGILQVVQDIKTDSYTESVAASGFSAEIPGLSASITPRSTSSKILVTVAIGGVYTVSGIKLLVNGSDSAYIGDTLGSRGRASSVATFGGSTTISYLHSPASTSTQTYTIKIQNQEASTQTIYFNSSSIDATRAPTSASSITLMEVAG